MTCAKISKRSARNKTSARSRPTEALKIVCRKDASPSSGSGRFGLWFLSNFAQVAFARTAVETEKSCDFFHSVILVGAEFATRTQDLMDYLVPLLSTFEIRWKHRWNSLKRSLLVDQKDIELLTHQLLEFGNRHVAVRLADAARQLEPTLVDCGAIHSNIDQAAHDRGP
jgi:hypothetical protein